jgi:ankyrin repeat protein
MNILTYISDSILYPAINHISFNYMNYQNIKSIYNYSCRIKNIKIVKLILKTHFADTPNWNNYAIYTTCRIGHIKIVKLLLSDSRVDPSDCKNRAVRYACRRGHHEIVKLLLLNIKVKNTLSHKEYQKYNINNI